MSLIDLKKLNAEVDELIRKQDEEVKAMNEQRQVILEQAFMWMVTDLVELKMAFVEMNIGTISPETEMVWKAVNNEKLQVEFLDDSPSSVIIRTKSCLAGRLWLEGSHSTYACFSRNFTSFGMAKEFVLRWREQYPIFKCRFEEECLKEIKKKAERANARYESARRELDETK